MQMEIDHSIDQMTICIAQGWVLEVMILDRLERCINYIGIPMGI
jgi:hypothetical protein